MDDDLKGCIDSLLLLLEFHGRRALVIEQEGDEVVVHCQYTKDVVPLCKAVIADYATPAGTTLQ